MRRLFYDVTTSRVRAEALLIIVDIIALASALLYATGALSGLVGWDPSGSGPTGPDPGRSGLPGPWDAALLTIWGAFPRAVAKILGRLEHQLRFFRAFGGSLLFVAATTVLLLAGWDILQGTMPKGEPFDPALIIVTFFAWCSGFFLFHPRTYRLHDFLLLGLVVVGARAGRPLAGLLVPLCLVSFFLSTAIRHVVHDVFPDAPRARVNLQNARAVAIVAAGAALAILAGAHILIRDGLGFVPDEVRRDSTPGSRLELGPSRNAGEEGAEGAAEDGGRSRAEAHEDGKVGARVVGFSYRVSLNDLTLARFDTREVLRVAAPEHPDWRPAADALWKAVTFSKYSPATESWEEDTAYRTLSWPEDGRLLVVREPAPEGGIILRHEVITPVFRNLVTTYEPVEFVTRAFASYRRYSSGDIFPRPQIQKGSVYRARMEPRARGAVASPAPGDGDARRYREIPPPGELELSLEGIAAEIFRPAGAGAEERIEALRRYYRDRGFRYSQNALWRSGSARLRKFILEERVGDCTYYATASALLLRAGGVPTRVAIGFLGQDWDEEKREAVVRNLGAHAWVEALVGPSGWLAVDPTSWVPPDPTYRPPPEVIQRVDVARGSTRPGVWSGAAAPRISSVGESRSGGPSRGVGARDRYYSEEIPRDPGTLDAAALEPTDEDGGLWIEYGGAFVDGEAVTSGAATHTDLTLVPRFEADEDSPSGAGAAPRRSGDKGREKGRLALGGTARTTLRIAIVLLGGLVLALLVRSFLRPAETETGDGAEEEEGGPLAAGADGGGSRGIDLDDLDPRDRILREYLHLQDILERTRAHRLPHQTPLEHGQRVAGGRQEVIVAFRDLHRVLYAVVYGGGRADEEQAAVTARSCRTIARLLG